MTDHRHNPARRRFLGGLAVLGTTPLARRLEALPQVHHHRWSGDHFDEGHDRLRNPRAWWDQLVAQGRTLEVEGLYDVIIIGGGISGLTVAYRLARRNPHLRLLLLEREHETGGVSKSESWKGIEYSIGAAYMIDPQPPEDDDPEHPSQERLNLDLLIELGLREEEEELEACNDKQRRWATHHNHVVFTRQRVLEDEEVLTAENVRFFEAVAESDHFPSIPPEDPQLVQALDTISFQEFLQNPALQQELYGRTVGEIPPAGWESIEYYFWGAFGTNTWETSAYHGLNFYAAEFTRLLVFPGGNAFIAKRLTERIRSLDERLIATGSYVLLAEPVADAEGQPHWQVKVERRQGGSRGYLYRTRAVVFASPIFLAKRMLPSLPLEQMQALDRLDYRSFVVANVLLTPPMKDIFGEGRILHSYEMQCARNTDPRHSPPDVLSQRNVFSDVVNATFAVCSERQPHTILTVYRPYPYAAGRELLRYLTYEYVEAEIRKAVLDAYGPHGLRPEHIQEIRLARWGHPMIIPRPGQLAEGLIEQCRRGQPGLFFSHTDIFGAPAIENALAAAHAAVRDVEAYLDRSESARVPAGSFSPTCPPGQFGT
ncbi:MAG: FAD-dependent oxidoreductase [Firmicutes bacterium]|nr:FAD-dependent oxidoreductase [Bacillota bacterium]